MATLTISGLTDVSYVSAVAAVVAAAVYGYNTTYTWRVDSVNEFGTTTGDEWTLTTIPFDPPMSIWENLPGKTLGPLTGGVEGTDFEFLGYNLTNTVKYVLGAAGDAIWYWRT
jgi:hypothetical protein